MRKIVRTRRRWIVGAAATLAGVVLGFGMLTALSQPRTPALPAMRQVQVFGTTLRVPHTWRKSMGANLGIRPRTVTFTGQTGQLTLTRYRFMGFLPLVGNVPSGPFLRNANSPYVISWHQTIAERPTYVAETTLPSGTGLTLQLTWRRRTREATRLSQHMLSRVRFPAPLTATQAVTALLRSPLNQMPGSSATITQRILQRHGRTQDWLLVSGASLADMTAWEPSYLFMTTNGGTTWHLMDYSCSGEPETVCALPGSRYFLGQATPVVMRFVSSTVGIIAQANRTAPLLDVYRTTDAGLKWDEHPYPIPNLSTAGAPTIAETSTGLLLLSVAIQGHTARVTYASANQGRTWHIMQSIMPQST